MQPNDIMPPINRFRSQNPQPPNAEAEKLPPMTRPPVVPQKPGISPGVQALMQRNATNNAKMPPGAGMAPGVQPVRPMQQFQGQPKPMPMQGNRQIQQRPMPPQGNRQMPPGQIVDPYMQRRLMAFRYMR